MKEFILAALPWVCIGLALAVFAANHAAAKKKTGEKPQGNYMTVGMCIGMCVGSGFSGNGLIYGMLLGLVIGMGIKKEKSK